jgi:hypothetical protein
VSRRSQKASATVGSPSPTCHGATGVRLVTTVLHGLARSPATSSRSTPRASVRGGRVSCPERVRRPAPSGERARQAPVEAGPGDLGEHARDARLEGRHGRPGSPRPGSDQGLLWISGMLRARAGPYANICETSDNFAPAPEFASALRCQVTDIRELRVDATWV